MVMVCKVGSLGSTTTVKLTTGSGTVVDVVDVDVVVVTSV
jgi:hypothetical protein